MPSLNGLYPFEKVMLILGAGFFVALAFVLVYLALKGKGYGKLLPFFLVPILMIAWPSVQSVQFSNDVLTIQTNLAALVNDTGNESTTDSLKTAVANVSARPSSDPATLTLLARASLALGDMTAASERVQQALAVDPKFQEANALKARIEAQPKLQTLTKQVEQDPKNDAAKAQLKQTIQTVTQVPVVNPVTLANLAKAQAAVGETEAANASVNKALKINPKLTEAVELKAKLQPTATPQ